MLCFRRLGKCFCLKNEQILLINFQHTPETMKKLKLWLKLLKNPSKTAEIVERSRENFLNGNPLEPHFRMSFRTSKLDRCFLQQSTQVVKKQRINNNHDLPNPSPRLVDKTPCCQKGEKPHEDAVEVKKRTIKHNLRRTLQPRFEPQFNDSTPHEDAKGG